MRAHAVVRADRMLSGWRPFALACVVVLLAGIVASAASYMKTTLRELTDRAGAVVEVEVLKKEYPAPKSGQIQRTHTTVKIVRTLKGALPETFVLDTPGGIQGDTVTYVADGADFKTGEKAIVFVREVEAGRYVVSGLGLGKFNLVERNGKRFVESPLCPKATIATKDDTKNLEATLLQKSIPYDTFCRLVQSYAAGETPVLNIADLADTLPAAAHHHGSPAVVAEAQAAKQAAQTRQALLVLVFFFAAVALVAAWWVRHRRRSNAAGMSSRMIVFVLSSALLGGAMLGAGCSYAFVENGAKWNLDIAISGKVANNRIIWRYGTASAENANAFTTLQAAYDAWEAVPNSRLAFTAGGTTTISITANDAENVAAWDTTVDRADFDTGTLAICYTNFVGTVTQDTDIIFNDEDFNWSAGGDGNIMSVGLHEIGHSIGLGHTTDPTTVMFPTDSGFLVLSNDEIAAAQALYPGADPPGGGGTPPAAVPPTATISASPTVGAVGMEVSFSGANSVIGSSTIALYQWDFGDGTIGTGKETTHRYTIFGVYTATLTVQDQEGQTDEASVEVRVGYVGVAQQGAFKLGGNGKDTFTIKMYSPLLVDFKAPKGEGEIAGASITIGSQTINFDYDTEKGKSVSKNVKAIVNDKEGTVTVTVRDNLSAALNALGAGSDGRISVPVTVLFGSGLNVGVTSTAPFVVKGGKGKF